ncbi:hypothetical protein Tco_1277677, partial [Tanacetum coccineum]
KRVNEVFECILLVMVKTLMKKLQDSDDEHQVLGRIVGFKRLQDILRVTAAQLQLLSDYYCWNDYADRDEINDLSEKR